jgi:hypothetical protein
MDRGGHQLFPAVAGRNRRALHHRPVAVDKAHLSQANVDAVEKFGATPFIPFKSNSRVPQTTLPELAGGWERIYHLFAYERETFLTN